MATVRSLKTPNNLKSSPTIPQTVSALHAVVAHVRLQRLDAVVRHHVFQAMIDRVEHMAAAAGKHGPDILQSGLFLGSWQLLKRDETVIKKVVGDHPLFGQRSSVPQASVRDKFSERPKVIPSFDKALAAAESTSSQIPIRGRTFGEFTSQDVFIDRKQSIRPVIGTNNSLLLHAAIPRKATDPPIPRLAHQLDRVLFKCVLTMGFLPF